MNDRISNLLFVLPKYPVRLQGYANSHGFLLTAANQPRII